MRKRRSRIFPPTSSRDEVIDLMVEYWARTGLLSTGAQSIPVAGDAEAILSRIEQIIDSRWCHHASFEYQADQLRAYPRNNLIEFEVA